MNILVGLFYISALHYAAGRITVNENPGCSEKTTSVNCSEPWLIHVLNQPSSNPNETEYHHLWGSIGAPTILTAQTKVFSELAVDWDALTQHTDVAVSFNPTPYNIFGVAISQVILFNDTNNSGNIENVPADQQKILPTHLFNWQYSISTTEKDSNTVSVQTKLFATTFNNTSLGENDKTGELSVIITNFDSKSRSGIFPKLQVTPSSSNVDVIMDHVTLTNASFIEDKSDVTPIGPFSAPRWAIRFVLISSESRNSSNDQNFKHTEQHSIDDEYAPGVFNLDEITTPRARNGSHLPEGGFVQWRPVVYYSSDRDVTKSTLPTLTSPNNSLFMHSPVTRKESLFVPDFILQLPTTFDNELEPLFNIDESLKKSLAYSVFGNNLTNVLSAETLISFGAPGDGFYTGYNYQVWTFTAGSGIATKESLSVGVLIALLCGVVLPLCTLLFAGFFVKAYQCKQARKKKGALLDNDELNEET